MDRDYAVIAATNQGGKGGPLATGQAIVNLVKWTGEATESRSPP
jgi:hypothetical protein